MRDSDYRKSKSKPDVLSFSVLTNTLQTLVANESFEIATEIQRIIRFNSVKKPDRHSDRANLSTSYFTVDLPGHYVETIIDLLGDLEAGAVGHDGETTALAAYYGSLLDAWSLVKQSATN